MDTKKLRQKILDLAIHGKLVPQDPNDEPASVLLERIRAEKERLMAEGKIKRSKKYDASDTSHYENVPFEVPEGWCWCNLEDIAQSNIGLTYKPADVTPDGVPVLRSNNIQNNKLCLDDVVRVTTEIRTNQFVSEGDLLICARNGSRRLVGKCALIRDITEPCSFGAFMAICKSAYNEWLFYILSSTYFSQYLDDSNSTTIYQVTQKMLLDLLIPFPPVQEQIRIASEIEKYISLIDILDEGKLGIDSAISLARSKILDLAIHGRLVSQDANDEPAKELLKRINPKAIASCDNPHYVGEIPSNWVWTTLGSIGKWQSGGTPSRMHKEYYGGNIPWLKTGDLNDGLVTDIPEHITELGLENSSAKLNPAGSVLIAMYGATIGKVGVLGIPATTNQACCACIEYKGITQQYLFLFLLASKANFVAAGGGGAQPNISKEIITKTLIPLPPIEEQNRIVAKVKELFSQLDMIEKSLQA